LRRRESVGIAEGKSSVNALRIELTCIDSGALRLHYGEEDGEYAIVCSGSLLGRSSGGLRLNGDLKPDSRERLCGWHSFL
jgi:hypothetical protein